MASLDQDAIINIIKMLSFVSHVESCPLRGAAVLIRRKCCFKRSPPSHTISNVFIMDARHTCCSLVYFKKSLEVQQSSIVSIGCSLQVMSFSVAKPLLAASLVATSLIYISYLWYKSREAEQVSF